MSKFGLTERDLNTIYKIFEKYPSIQLVHIFGSRAKGNYIASSDIDLAIMNSGASLGIISQIKGDFEESSLPYFVDLIDFTTLNHKELKEHIERVGVRFFNR